MVATMSQQPSTERARQVPVISTSIGGGVTTATQPAPLPTCAFTEPESAEPEGSC